jgi:hypothetical protein
MTGYALPSRAPPFCVDSYANQPEAKEQKRRWLGYFDARFTVSPSKEVYFRILQCKYRAFHLTY